jgi:hypothetical protein
MSCWAIVDNRTSEIRGTGATEGQAWIAALGLAGRCFGVDWLMRLVWTSGCHAVELRNSHLSC